MKISRVWLQTYFAKPLPKTEELTNGLTMHAFEIDGVSKFQNDDILDVKVLPNRAHDCLSYYGIAKEVSTIFEIPLDKKLLEGEIRKLPESNEFSVKIETKNVKRFKAVNIHGVKVSPSPQWLKTRIEAMGGKSINNIVDITNFVMFELGQPMHAFDADKLTKKGGLSFIIRESREGEKITTLDGVERTLTEGAILITDGETDGKNMLGIAGIKGGAAAEITEKTENIILEAATFDAPTIRKQAKLLNIRTDASIRFENDLAPELPTYAIDYAVKIIEELAKGENFRVEGEFDYFPLKKNVYRLGVSVGEINSILGITLEETEVEKILKRLNFPYDKIKNPLQYIVEESKEYIGAPYVLGASISSDAPHKFDCSSFTSFLYLTAGIAIPRVSVDQYVCGEKIDEKDAIPGDLVFSNTGEKHIWFETHEFMKGTKVREGVDHVGVYLGNDEVIHSNGGSGNVLKEKLSESNRFKNIVGFRRFVKTDEVRLMVSVPFERLDLRIKEDLIEEIGRIYGLEHIPALLPEPLGREPEVNREFFDAQKIREVLVSEGYSEVYTYALVSRGEVEIENPLASDKNFMRANLSDGIKKSLELNSKNAPLLGLNEIRIFEIGNIFGKNKEETYVCLGSILKGKVNVEEFSLAAAYEKYGHKEIEKCKPKENVKYSPISPYPFALRDIAIFVPSNTSSNEVEKVIRENAGEYLVRLDLFDKFEKEEKISYAFHLVFQSLERTLTENELNDSMTKVTAKINSLGWTVR